MLGYDRMTPYQCDNVGSSHKYCIDDEEMSSREICNICCHKCSMDCKKKCKKPSRTATFPKAPIAFKRTIRYR